MRELSGIGGGGQLLRTALALSAATNQPFHMADVRGARDDPGLKPQHCAAVELIADVCDADVSGVGVGSTDLTFIPQAVEPGQYEVDIGTAGSISLIFDTVLPLALATPGPLTITAMGGTDVKWSPPIDYLARVKRPLLAEWGLGLHVDVERRGFYPVGGGRATLHLTPSSPGPLKRTTRGDLVTVRIHSIASTHLRAAAVADRQAAAAGDRLQTAGITAERSARYVEADSPGSTVVIAMEYEHTLAGFSALGEPGRPAERVGESAADAALAFRGGPGAVDQHMADQVVPLLALAGGEVCIPEVNDHISSAVDLVKSFGFDVGIEARGDEIVLVAARPD